MKKIIPPIQRETELKIDVSADALEKLVRRITRRRQVHHAYLLRLYFDTKSLFFYKQKMTVRLQYQPGKNGARGSYYQCIKTSDGVASEPHILKRLEKSSIVPEAEPVIPGFKKKLYHLFTTEMERRYVVITRGKSKIEMAFDCGWIIVPETGRRKPFAEIELELKKGSPHDLQKAAEDILRLAPTARIKKNRSKADDGFSLYVQSIR